LIFEGAFIRFQARSLCIQSNIDPHSLMFGPLINIREFWICFTAVSYVHMLVLQWWFFNKLGFWRFWWFFQTLKTKELVFGLLILRET
jgi:hypothetical protein